MTQRRQIGYLERALRLYEQGNEAERVAEVHARLGLAYSVFGPLIDVPRAMEHYRAAEPILARQPGGTALASFYFGLGWAAAMDLRRQDALAAYSRAIELSEHLGDEPLRRRAETFYGAQLAHLGRLEEGLAILERVWETAPRPHVQPGPYSAADQRSHFARWLGDPRVGRAWATRELGEPGMVHFPVWQQILKRNLGLSLVDAGDLSEARAVLGEAEVTRDMGLKGQLAFREGDWDQAEVHWTEGMELAQQGGERFNQQFALAGLAELRLAQGRTEDAEKLIGELLAIVADQNLPLELPARTALAILAAEGGRSAMAMAELDRCHEIVNNGEDWRGLSGHVALADAVLRAAQGRLVEAEPLFERAVAVFQRYCLPWAEAEAWYRWGRALRGARRRTEAIEKLARASRIYEDHGAGERWLVRVAEESGRVAGGSSTKRAVSQGYPDRLSEREVEVLRLIAAGCSNADIARQLVISTNTVLRHVNHIFNKAGVSNRAEAASYAHRRGLVE